jgi:predicted flap endonuclease-1-like 5' DNA nuclease
MTDEELTDVLEIMPFQDVDLAEIRASAMALAVESGTVNRIWDGTEPDDFETFEGIGVIYERRLYNAGYCTYEALAAATPEELEAICRPPAFNKPDFASWIATAQILAAAKGASEA